MSSDFNVDIKVKLVLPSSGSHLVKGSPVNPGVQLQIGLCVIT